MKTFKLILPVLFICCSLPGFSQSPYLPNDVYDEEKHPSFVYVENGGQLHDINNQLINHIKYYNDERLPRIYLGENDFYFVSVSKDTSGLDSLFRIRMQFEDEAGYPTIVPTALGDDEIPRNYYLPHCGNGVEDQHGFERIVYEEVYPSIDFHYYSNRIGPKTYTVIHPGGDPEDILMHFTGQDSINDSTNGSIAMYIQRHAFVFEEMIAYEIDDNGNTNLLNWKPTYNNQGNGRVSITCGTYDTDKVLVLMNAMPVPQWAQSNPPIQNMMWSTHLPSFSGYDLDIKTDVDDNVFVASEIEDKVFPGASFHHGYKTSYDAAVVGFDDDHKKMFLCYWGSSKNDTYIKIAVDHNDHVYIGGTSEGSGLIVKGPSGSYQDNINPDAVTDWMIGKIYYGQNNGTLFRGQLIWSTYLGGNGGFDQFADLTTDDNGNLYVIGKGNSNMPIQTLSGAYNSTSGDGVIYKFNSTGAMLWGTRFGNVAVPTFRFRDIQVDSQGRVIVCGSVPNAGTFPLVDPGGGAHHPTYAGGSYDAFLTIFNPNHSIFMSSYLGGTGLDIGYNLAIDASDNIFLTGMVDNTGFTTLDAGNGAYFDNSYNGTGTQSLIIGDAFISKFDKDGVLLHSTYYGGRADENGWDVEVDINDNLYVFGSTTSDNLPLKPLALAYQENAQSNGNDDDENSFLTVFDPDFKHKWATYLANADPTVSPSTNNVLSYGYSMATSSNERLYCVGFYGPPNAPGAFPLVEYPGGFFDNTPNGTYLTAFNVNYQTLSALNYDKTKMPFRVYPNPASTSIIIEALGSMEGVRKIRVYNSLGAIIHVGESDLNSSYRIDTRIWDSGIYFVHVGAESQKIVIFRD
ncbi:SBBP repeat-containing protein [bacterium SCSIO 12741]|nr:SBBP repeat-containing protein [bacterium SCSIO 12741]